MVLQTTEMLRTALLRLFPDGTDDGLDRAAKLLLRWGAEGVGRRLTMAHAVALMYDLKAVTGSNRDLDDVLLPDLPKGRDLPESFWRVGRDQDRAARPG